MSFQNISPDGVILGSGRLIRAGLEGGKSVVAYSKPALEKSASLTAQAASWGVKNPVPATCVAIGTAGALVFVAPAVVTVPLLSSMGFTAGGIKAGTIAAVAQSQIGNIVAGSTMAVAQSAGAGGSGLVIINGIVQLGGAATTVGGTSLACVKAKL
ncbi:hypothetical protein N7495_009953 [Penicillium taxi]|uniref:uncharacterized protein n=1 Tax=Penicillium taxi TaxID=168475 RepID=UPI0025457ED3|nr:uncharacterized protein N7495_009953 [Penicillium taxi]KAJ5885443.1 hypothetical protein N7495_009953 [Penicillium taxi]